MKRAHLAWPFAGLGLGLGYGLFARWVFGEGSREAGLTDVFAGVSIGFLFLVPFGLGVLTASQAPRDDRRRWLYWLLLPAFSAALLLGATLLLAWEGAICIVMAAPVVIGMAMTGGLLVGVVVTLRQRRAPPGVVAGCLLLPFLFAPAEARIARREQLREVVTEVEIAALPSAVWRQVVRVPRIEDREQSLGFFHAIGIPRPLEATLSHDGIEGLREARFEGGLRFEERVSEWEPERRLGFTIEVAPGSLSAAVLDEHVAVGGPMFDVEFGRFELEAAGSGTRLRLLSRHRLSTTLNAYAGLWTDAVMRDIQRNICQVIRSRAERAATRAPTAP